MELFSERFIDFIKSNRVYGWVGIGASILLFFIFKLLFPYPHMVMDSYVYIKAMVLDMGANSFPIGYSRFLQLFSFFSRNTMVLVWVQYLLLSFSCLCLFYTLLYIFRPGRVVTIVFFIFLFCNPLFIYLGNFIMADTLFMALSIGWLTQLLWIIVRPRGYMILTHGLLIALAFTVRYNALYYPIVASAILLVSRRISLRYKLVTIGVQFALIGLFILYTNVQMGKLTGVRQFSPFGGWKLANNALYMYGHVYREDKTPVPAKFGGLDSLVRRYFDITHRVDDLLDYNAYSTGSLYMSDKGSPLFIYMYRKYGWDTIFQNFKKWGPMGPLCSAYGSYLAWRHPFAFTRYFIWPNLVRYTIPPPEILSFNSPYFLRDDDYGEMASKWFHLNTLTVQWRNIRLRNAVLGPYPYIVTLIHLLFVLNCIIFFAVGAYHRLGAIQRFVVLALGITWLCDVGFNITASPPVLRYQVFSMIIELFLALLFMDAIYRREGAYEKNS